MLALQRVTGAVLVGGAALLYLRPNGKGAEPLIDYSLPVPSRAEQLARLNEGTRKSPFDVLIIGGGATGAGCALEAATR